MNSILLQQYLLLGKPKCMNESDLSTNLVVLECLVDFIVNVSKYGHIS